MTSSTLIQRAQALSRYCDVLSAWSIRQQFPLEHWTLTPHAGVRQDMRLGEAWIPTPDDQPLCFEARWSVPETLEDALLELDLGGEGEVHLRLEGLECGSGGLNPFHRQFPLGQVRAGQRLEVRAEVVARGLFGRPTPAPALALARVVTLERELLDLILDLRVTLEVCAQLEGHEVVPQLLGVAEEAVARLAWPSHTPAVLGRGREVLGEWYAAGIWRLPEFPAAQPLSGEARTSVDTARAHLRAELERLRLRYPPVGQLALSGHAHLDLGWLWPVHETRRKLRRTFRTVLGLMERSPDFGFNQSSAQVYAWLEQDDPALFSRVRERVLEGRIEAVGGSWVEPDGQMPSGESWARQFLYGQRYFQQTFGRRSPVLWLPDTFGYTPALPQILLQAGISGFFTTKLSWNETNRFPHDLFCWEGIDGSRVTVHMFHNPGGTTDGTGAYNGELRARDLHGTWSNFRGKGLRVWEERDPASLFTYGYGDGGGGPSSEHLERFERLRDFPAMPRLRHSRVDDFFAQLPRQNLPVWVGELYLELHRATLTTQGRIKRLNREAEHRLLEAEVLCSLRWLAGAEYPTAPLERAWKTLLLNQFHDILPGSSIAEVYATAQLELEGVVREALELRGQGSSAQGSSGQGSSGQGWTVFNPALGTRPLRALLPGASGTVVTEGGRTLPSQSVEGGVLVFGEESEIPALHGVQLTLGAPSAPAVLATGTGVTLEQTSQVTVLQNGILRVEIDPRGQIGRVLDLRAGNGGREVLEGPGNLLVAYPDLPREWEAWDTATTIAQPGEALLEVESISVLERGPLRASVRVTRRWRSSTLVQTYRLSVGSARLEIETEIDWHERRVLLRALFPLRVRTAHASFETAFGALTRPTHRNTSWDQARFEGCGHRWADLSEPGYGVALLNNGRYGHEVLGSTLALSLVRGPMFPDPLADEGLHRFSYALYPHVGDAAQGGVALEALDLNSPPLVLPGALENPLEGFAAHGLPLMLSGLKKAEDGEALILRVYEPHGARGQAAFRIPGIRRVTRVNLLEDRGEDLELEGEAFTLEVGPFEIVSLALEFGALRN